MKQKKILSILLSIPLILGCLSGFITANATQGDNSSFVESFQNPTKETQPKIRYWWQGANGKTDDDIYREIKSIADAGFTSVEMIKMDSRDQIDLEEYGWGTDRWNHVSEVVIAAAEEYGITVDFTIGPRWPSASTEITVNDELASQKMVYSVKELSTTDFVLENGQYVYQGGVPKETESDYEQRFIAATIAKKTGGVHTKKVSFTKFGNTIESELSIYELDENSLQAVEVSEESGLVNWSIPSTENPEDYIMYGFYAQGTGQTVSGVTAKDSVVIDHYSADATRMVLSKWENELFTDTIKEHFKEYGGDFFEDSLELTESIVPWTKGTLDLFKQEYGYDLTKYLPVLVERLNTSATTTPLYGFKDQSDELIVNDYIDLFNHLYQKNHLQVITEWAKEYNMNYRAQVYAGMDTGIYDSNYSAAIVGTAEGESLAFSVNDDGMDSSEYDCFRNLSGGVHMAGKQILSDELGAVRNYNYRLSFTKLVETINRNVSGGVNQFVLHGTPSQSDNEYVTWPGYHGWIGKYWSEDWEDRQPVWENMEILTDYMARIQQVMQSGTAKMDLAVFYDEKTATRQFFENDSLTSYGYSYELLSPDTLELPMATVKNGVLASEGAAYRAMVFYNQNDMSLSMVEKLQDYADNGLKLIFIGDTPTEIKNYANYQQEREQMNAAMQKLLVSENVYQISSTDELAGKLEEIDLDGNVKYSTQVGVMTLRREDGKTNYYWMYNKSEQDQNVTVSLTGTGIPYALDLWTGEITPVAQYTVEDGTVTIPVNLNAGEARVYAITPEALVETPKTHVTAGTANRYFYDQNGNIIVSSDQKGTYATVLSDGTVKQSELSFESYAVALKDQTWNLAIERWSEPDNGDPNGMKKTILNYQLSSLAAWKELEPDIPTMSGRGTYTTTVNLEQWQPGKIAQLQLSVGSGTVAITTITVNGTELPVVDQTLKSVDISNYVTQGENTIQIATASSLYNEVFQGEDEIGLLDAAIQISDCDVISIQRELDSDSSDEQPSQPSEPSNPVEDGFNSSTDQVAVPSTGDHNMILVVFGVIMVLGMSICIICRNRKHS